MNLRKTVKQNAKAALSGHWGRAIGVLVIPIGIGMVISVLEQGIFLRIGQAMSFDYYNTPDYFLDDLPALSAAAIVLWLLSMAITLCVSVPLMQGELRWFVRRTGGADDPVSSVFHSFTSAKAFLKAVGMNVQIGLRIIGWGLCFYLATLFIFMFSGLAAAFDGYAVRAAGVVLMFMVLIGLWCAMVAMMLRYTLAPFLLAMDDGLSLTVGEYIEKSIRYMKGHKWDMFVFFLSFFGWYLLFMPIGILGAAMGPAGVMLVPVAVIVGMLFLGPYMYAATALYARYIIESGDRSSGGATREYVQKTEIDQYLQSQQGAGYAPPPQQPPYTPPTPPAQPPYTPPTQQEAPPAWGAPPKPAPPADTPPAEQNPWDAPQDPNPWDSPQE